MLLRSSTARFKKHLIITMRQAGGRAYWASLLSRASAQHPPPQHVVDLTADSPEPNSVSVGRMREDASIPAAPMPNHTRFKLTRIALSSQLLSRGEHSSTADDQHAQQRRPVSPARQQPSVTAARGTSGAWVEEETGSERTDNRSAPVFADAPPAPSGLMRRNDRAADSDQRHRSAEAAATKPGRPRGRPLGSRNGSRLLANQAAGLPLYSSSSRHQQLLSAAADVAAAARGLSSVSLLGASAAPPLEFDHVDDVTREPKQGGATERPPAAAPSEAGVPLARYRSFSFDIETTGFDRVSSRILDIAVVDVETGRSVASKQNVNPERGRWLFRSPEKCLS